MNTFYFNTGVRSENSSILMKGQVWKDGVKQIPFDCDVPKNANLMFLCDNPKLDESKLSNVIVVEVFNTAILSKYAYFRIENKKDYYRQDNIGKCKYTVNFHNGIDKHKDGSKFYSIKIFKNKPSLFKFINKLKKEGYVMK